MKKQDHQLEKTWFVMPYKLKPISIKAGAEIRFPDAFAEIFIKKFTKKGDVVFDPFAGFGTTLFAAERLGRIGIGIEYDRKRYEYIEKKLKLPSRIIHGDSRKIRKYKLPLFDFSMTSPPYMQSHHKENPLQNYTKAGNYKRYLAGIRKIYSNVKPLMKKKAAIVLEVSNIAGKDGHPMTPLAWDIAREISKVFFFEREFVYCHKNGDMKSNTGCHSYCLVFRNR